MAEDISALTAARQALIAAGHVQGDNDELVIADRRRVLALEFRLGCKLGAMSVLKDLRSEPADSAEAGHLFSVPQQWGGM